MNRNEPSISPESLLKHTPWVNKLAASLVGEDRADDLVQEVWLAALKQPRVSAPRAWLASVVRNLANVTRRREYARRRRETLVARPEKDSSCPEKLMERYELQRLIVGLVGQLEEPYRSTVLLRYMEELSTKEIANRQDVAVTTVRGRLTKALEKLRGNLDRAHGGKRQVWLKVLVPTAGLGAVSSSAPAVAVQSWTADVAGNAAVSALSIGAAAMKFKVAGFLAAVSMIALASGIGIGRLMPPASSDSSSRSQLALNDLQQRYEGLKNERDEIEAQRVSESMKVQRLEQQLATTSGLDEERPIIAEEPEDRESLRKKLALLRDWFDAHPMPDRTSSVSEWAEFTVGFQEAAAGIRELIPSNAKAFFEFFNAQDDAMILAYVSKFILGNARVSEDGGIVIGNLRFVDLEPSIEAGIFETLQNGAGAPLRAVLQLSLQLSGDIPNSFRETFWGVLSDEAVQSAEKFLALTAIAKQTGMSPEEQEQILRYAQGLTEPDLILPTVRLLDRTEPSSAAETLFNMFPDEGTNLEAREYISGALSATFRRMTSDHSRAYEAPLQRAFLKENSETSFYHLVDATLSLPPDQALRLLRTAETNIPSDRAKSGLQAVLTRLEGGDTSSAALRAAYSEASGSMLQDILEARRKEMKEIYR